MQSRDAWLKERKELLTASDVAAILGENPFKNNVMVYMDKISDEICQEDKDHLKFGRDVEGAIANLYESKTGYRVQDPGETRILRHPDIEWLGATLDRYTYRLEEVDAIRVPLELKHVGGFGVYKDDWVEDPPSYNQIQLQIQCACDKAPFGVLAGMFPGYDLGYKEIEYSESFFETIYPVLDEFWNHNVKKKIPPALIEHSKNLESMKALYCEENGETVVIEAADFDNVIAWESLKHNRSELNSQIKDLESKIREKVGNATFARLPDGRFLTLKTTKRKGYTVEPKEFRTLRTTKRLR